MNKSGHMLVTKKMIPKELNEYSLWLQLGSILPDVFVHTYLGGHTWNRSFKKTMRKMSKLGEWGEMNGFSCLCLGYLLHYIEDYFTFPHNEGFTGDIAEHVLYEKNLTQLLKDQTVSNDMLWQDEVEAISISQLRFYLEELHEVYEQEKNSYNMDCFYIQEAVKNVLMCFASIFRKNKKYYEDAVLEAMQLSSQNYYFSLGLEGNV